MGLDSAYGPYPCHPKPYCAPCHLKPNKYYVLINPCHPLTAAHSSACAPSPRSETLETPERHSAGTVSPKLPCSACPHPGTSVPRLRRVPHTSVAPRITEHALGSCAPSTHRPPRCSSWNGTGRPCPQNCRPHAPHGGWTEELLLTSPNPAPVPKCHLPSHPGPHVPGPSAPCTW